MAGPSNPPRRIIESATFVSHATQLIPDPKLRDELLEGVLFVMARVPEEFQRIGNTRLHVARLTGPAGILRLRIWFVYDDDTVELMGMDFDDATD